jgi:hypothetical protein
MNLGEFTCFWIARNALLLEDPSGMSGLERGSLETASTASYSRKSRQIKRFTDLTLRLDCKDRQRCGRSSDTAEDGPTLCRLIQGGAEDDCPWVCAKYGRA